LSSGRSPLESLEFPNKLTLSVAYQQAFRRGVSPVTLGVTSYNAHLVVFDKTTGLPAEFAFDDNQSVVESMMPSGTLLHRFFFFCQRSNLISKHVQVPRWHGLETISSGSSGSLRRKNDCCRLLPLWM